MSCSARPQLLEAFFDLLFDLEFARDLCRIRLRLLWDIYELAIAAIWLLRSAPPF